MTPSQALLNFLAQPQMENCELASYQDGGGIWTIGVGHTLGVTADMSCTRSQALLWLSDDMVTTATEVNRCITQPMLQREFDAFCSLCFNIGIGNFREHFSGVGLFNLGEKQLCADHFDLWNRDAGQISPGLVTRRAAERAMFLGIHNEFLAAYTDQPQAA